MNTVKEGKYTTVGGNTFEIESDKDYTGGYIVYLNHFIEIYCARVRKTNSLGFDNYTLYDYNDNIIAIIN